MSEKNLEEEGEEVNLFILEQQQEMDSILSKLMLLPNVSDIFFNALDTPTFFNLRMVSKKISKEASENVTFLHVTSYSAFLCLLSSPNNKLKKMILSNGSNNLLTAWNNSIDKKLKGERVCTCLEFSAKIFPSLRHLECFSLRNQTKLDLQEITWLKSIRLENCTSLLFCNIASENLSCFHVSKCSRDLRIKWTSPSLPCLTSLTIDGSYPQLCSCFSNEWLAQAHLAHLTVIDHKMLTSTIKLNMKIMERLEIKGCNIDCIHFLNACDNLRVLFLNVPNMEFVFETQSIDCYFPSLVHVEARYTGNIDPFFNFLQPQHFPCIQTLLVTSLFCTKPVRLSKFPSLQQLRCYVDSLQITLDNMNSLKILHLCNIHLVNATQLPMLEDLIVRFYMEMKGLSLVDMPNLRNCSLETNESMGEFHPNLVNFSPKTNRLESLTIPMFQTSSNTFSPSHILNLLHKSSSSSSSSIQHLEITSFDSCPSDTTFLQQLTSIPFLKKLVLKKFKCESVVVGQEAASLQQLEFRDCRIRSLVFINIPALKQLMLDHMDIMTIICWNLPLLSSIKLASSFHSINSVSLHNLPILQEFKHKQIHYLSVSGSTPEIK